MPATANGPYTTIATVTGTSFFDAAVSVGNTYYYAISGYASGSESSDSAPVGLTLSVPTAAPTGLKATAGNGLAIVSWNALAGASSYLLKRGTISGGPYDTTVVAATPGTTFTEAGLTNGTTYYYVVTARLFNNSGPASAQVAVMPATSITLISRAIGGTALASVQHVTEVAANCFDGSTSTKWFDAPESKAWLQYRFANGASWAISQYRVTSANDVPGRDPKDWDFQGSNDGVVWTTLDQQASQTFTARLQTKTYTVASPAPYRYYRLNITANFSGTAGIQLSEFALYSSATEAGDKFAPVLALPSPIKVTAAQPSGVVIGFSAQADDAIEGSVPVVCAPPAFSLFPVGTSTIQAAATDGAGNCATGSFFVTVNPMITPEETVAPPVTMNDGTASLSLNTVTGRTYQLQRSFTLESDSWVNVGPVRDGGGSLDFSDTPTAPDGKVFYRVLIGP